MKPKTVKILAIAGGVVGVAALGTGIYLLVKPGTASASPSLPASSSGGQHATGAPAPAPGIAVFTSTMADGTQASIHVGDYVVLLAAPGQLVTGDPTLLPPVTAIPANFQAGVDQAATTVFPSGTPTFPTVAQYYEFQATATGQVALLVADSQTGQVLASYVVNIS